MSVNLKSGQISAKNNASNGNKSRPESVRVRRRRNRRRRRAAQVIGMDEQQYRLHQCFPRSTINYAESVVNPFALEAIGSKRPDKRTTTLGATDRLDLLLPIQSIAESMGNNFGGFMISFLPRSIKSGWLEGSNTVTTSGLQTLTPSLASLALDSSFSSSGSEPLATIGQAYCLLFTILGVDGKFYALNQPNQTEAVFEGVNYVQTSRMASLEQNFDTLRINGAGLKMWANEAPINTGGRIFAGSYRAADIYDILTGESSVNSLNVESAMKKKLHFTGLEGTTLRYEPLIDPVQKECKQLQNYIRQDLITSGSIVNNIFEVDTSGSYKLHDLADPNSLIPTAIWRYSSTIYDISLRLVVHVEGATDGVCPFEAISTPPDYNIEHLDHFLNSPMFPFSVKGHSFKSFMEKAKQIVSKASKGATNAARIMKLLEQFAAQL